MPKILKIKNANDYSRYVGAERQASAGQRGGVCGRVARQEQPEYL